MVVSGTKILKGEFTEYEIMELNSNLSYNFLGIGKIFQNIVHREIILKKYFKMNFSGYNKNITTLLLNLTFIQNITDYYTNFKIADRQYIFTETISLIIYYYTSCISNDILYHCFNYFKIIYAKNTIYEKYQ